MKISIVSENTRNLEELRRFVEADRRHDVKVLQGSMTALGPVADQQAPDALIVEVNGQARPDFDALTRLNLTHPSITLLLVLPEQSPDVLLAAMRAGVREVLPAPVSRDVLTAALARIEEKHALQNPTRQKGRVLAFIPCKGGSGATFLATNLAYVLATQENKSVVVLDLSLQFGDAALFITDHRPATNLAEVARQIHRMDAAFLASSLLPVTPNLGVLAAPEDPVQAMDVKPEHIETLLNLARYHYDIVVVDIGRGLDPVSIKALDQADWIFPVLQITLPFIRDAKRLLDVFRSLGYARDKVKLLVNRYEAGGDIRLEDVERTLSAGVFKTLPNSFKAVAASVNQGVPIARLSPKNPVTRNLQELAKTIARPEAEAGWWSNLTQRK